MPNFLGDSAMIYRTLHDLEEAGDVITRWDVQESGPPKKFYKLTEQGWQKLLEFEVDITKRMANFKYFLTTLAELKR